MKILFTFLTYGKDIFGGVEKSIYNLIEGLIKINTDAVIFTGKKYEKNKPKCHKVYYSDYLIQDFDTNQVNKQILENYSTYNKQIHDELINIINIENPDYILAIDHIWGIIPYVDIFSKIKCPIGIVFHMLHESDLISKMFDYPFDHFFCVSNFVREKVMKLNFNEKEVVILPNSISNDFFINNNNKLGKSNIFCNARISYGKGTKYLIEAFKSILIKYPECRLYLCNGDFHFMKKFDFSDEISRINSSFEEDKIILLPNLSWDTISKVLQNMDLVVLPTEMETFGLGALETIASRIPLITTKNGNLSDLLKDSAYFIENITSKEIFDAIDSILSEKASMERKIEEGYQIAKEYTNTKVASDFVKYIIDFKVGDKVE